MAKRASSGVNRNLPNTPDPDAILRALAAEIADQGAFVAIRERRKEHRKAAELEGVNLKELDDLFKNRDLTAEEIEALFRRKWAHFAAVFSDLSDQLDLFSPKASSRETKAAYAHAGRMAALNGKAAIPPDGLVGEPLQEWLAGWTAAREARVNATTHLADALAAAIKIADEGGIVDGTTADVKPVEKPDKKPSRSAKAKAVALKAAEDFEQDNDPLTVGGIRYLTQEGADEARAILRGVANDPIGGPTAEEAQF